MEFSCQPDYMTPIILLTNALYPVRRWLTRPTVAGHDDFQPIHSLWIAPLRSGAWANTYAASVGDTIQAWNEYGSATSQADRIRSGQTAASTTNHHRSANKRECPNRHYVGRVGGCLTCSADVCGC